MTRDSWNDPGTWQATGANETNLQAMIANPNDLYGGQGHRGVSGVIAATTVNRVVTDQVKPLPQVSGTTFGGGAAGASGGGQILGPK